MLNALGVLGSSLNKITCLQQIVSLLLAFCCQVNFLNCVHFPFLFLLVLESNELHIEIECRVWGNSWRRSTSTISIFWRANQSGYFSFLHASKSFIPSLNDHSLTEGEFEGVFSVLIWIKLRSIFKGSTIQCKNFLAFGRELALTFWIDNLGEFSLHQFFSP